MVTQGLAEGLGWEWVNRALDQRGGVLASVLCAKCLETGLQQPSVPNSLSGAEAAVQRGLWYIKGLAEARVSKRCSSSSSVSYMLRVFQVSFCC